jgi:hypothetical protein
LPRAVKAKAESKDLADAAQTPDGATRLADALRDVVPPITRKKRLRGWRGIIVDKGDPSEAVLGLSWTRDRDVAPRSQAVGEPLDALNLSTESVPVSAAI